MSVINLTQHNATPDQIADGVVDLPDTEAKEIRELLTFNERPTLGVLAKRAGKILSVLNNYTGGTRGHVMIGGAPFFMNILEGFLAHQGYTPCYAFSKRVVEEQVQEDGSVNKSVVFRHEGFVPTIHQI